MEEKLSTNQLYNLKNGEKLNYLKDQWNIPDNEPILVFGYVYKYGSDKNNNDLYWLKNVKNLNGVIIEYPTGILNSTIDRIFIGPNGDKFDGCYVRAELVLSNPGEMERQKNPLLLRCKGESIKELSQSIKEKIIDEEELIKNIVLENDIKKQKIKDNIKILEKEKKDLEFKLNKENKKLSANQELNFKIQDTIEEKSSIKEKLVNDIDNLNILKKEKEEMINRDINKLKEYVKDKAEWLKKLEFISDEQFEKLTLKDSETSDEPIGDDFKDFNKDLEKDLKKAVSHIQGYLFEKNIIYPRYIIENYFCLLQTNDLIILAGDSGSGKTNLVKSFADAVGGKAKIIPVKPNWTSSEDLLGYYNPLQKKYLSTLFLDTLIEAEQNPNIPYFICLDEMNLARVEYYFADFLSILEERKEEPEIHLYSDSESNHILTELRNVIRSIDKIKENNESEISNFSDVLNDKKLSKEIRETLGLGEKDSLIKYHTFLSKLVSGALDMPSKIKFPKNVRIIGAINIDETTNFLSPKVVDRAHFMKFDNPLLYDMNKIKDEIDNTINNFKKVKFAIDDFGVRDDYPQINYENDFESQIITLTKSFFSKLGLEIGFRTIRQGINYIEKYSCFNGDSYLALNNFILHKLLPKFTFDGDIKIEKDKNKIALVKEFLEEIESILDSKIPEENLNKLAAKELKAMVNKAEENDNYINYWI